MSSLYLFPLSFNGRQGVRVDRESASHHDHMYGLSGCQASALIKGTEGTLLSSLVAQSGASLFQHGHSPLGTPSMATNTEMFADRSNTTYSKKEF